LKSVRSLPEDERLELLEALIADCDQALARPFDETWLAEIRRRSGEIDAGTAALTPWSEAKRRVRERLEGQSGG
jgi:putative addiction module component (TIGR02574 family)